MSEKKGWLDESLSRRAYWIYMGSIVLPLVVSIWFVFVRNYSGGWFYASTGVMAFQFLFGWYYIDRIDKKLTRRSRK